MFVDIVKVPVIAGNGGDGIVSFRHEKFVDKGGPDGGDGGHGGNVIIKATRNENTLAMFRYQQRIEAEHGQAGSKRNKHGKTGKDLIVKVPMGTMIKDLDTLEILADLVNDGDEVIIAKGGQGGFGNAHFTSSVRQAPRVAEKGEKGVSRTVILEMRLVADVGLIGMPNAGKSTMLSVISNAKPQIGSYAFTTTTPNLGVVDIDGRSLLMADIPGLIEGASAGKGLGDEFLRHVTRCKVLLHLIDITSNDIAKDYTQIVQELKNHSKELAEKPQIVVLTKAELVDDDIAAMQKELLAPALQYSEEVFVVSAHAHEHLKELLRAVVKIVTSMEQAEQVIKDAEADMPTITLVDTDLPWRTKQLSDGVYLVTGRRIEKFARRTDFTNEHGVMRLKDILKKMGITHELIKNGIAPGDTIIIGDPISGELKF